VRWGGGSWGGGGAIGNRTCVYETSRMSVAASSARLRLASASPAPAACDRGSASGRVGAVICTNSDVSMSPCRYSWTSCAMLPTGTGSSEASRRERAADVHR
jgi:hypothetical protein